MCVGGGSDLNQLTVGVGGGGMGSESRVRKERRGIQDEIGQVRRKKARSGDKRYELERQRG